MGSRDRSRPPEFVDRRDSGHRGHPRHFVRDLARGVEYLPAGVACASTETLSAPVVCWRWMR